MNTPPDSRYIKQSRKFHDAWAFILYIISFVGFTTYSILNIQENKMELLFNSDTLRNGIICSSVVCVFILLNFLGLRYIPELFLKTTICLFPILTIIGGIMSGGLYGILFAGVSLIIWGLFVYNYWSMLKVVGKILQTAVSILLSNFFTVLIGIIACTTLQCFQAFLMLATNTDEIFGEKKNWTAGLFAFFYVLNFFWTLTSILYFFKVYITSIIALNVIEQGEDSGSKFGGIIKNSVYALGSICFAALLVSIVTTLRFFVNQERSRRREGNESNPLVDILLCLANVLLAVLETFIQFTNDLTLPYIAIHGEGYVDSIEKAYNVSLRQSPLAVTGMIALDYSLLISTLLVTSMCGISAVWHLARNTPDFILIKSMAVTTLIPLLFYFTTMMIISSAYLGLVYLEAEDPQLVKSRYIEDVKNTLSTYK